VSFLTADLLVSASTSFCSFTIFFVLVEFSLDVRVEIVIGLVGCDGWHSSCAL